MAIGKPSPDVRRANFGRFVSRALATARERGLTVAAVQRATGISTTTIYRWRNGEWAKDPRASEVRAFCEGLGLSLRMAYDALGWSSSQSAEPEPQVLDPDLRLLMRKLADPNTNEATKDFIRKSLRMLAALPDVAPPDDPPRSRRRAS